MVTHASVSAVSYLHKDQCSTDVSHSQSYTCEDADCVLVIPIVRDLPHCVNIPLGHSLWQSACKEQHFHQYLECTENRSLHHKKGVYRFGSGTTRYQPPEVETLAYSSMDATKQGKGGRICRPGHDVRACNPQITFAQEHVLLGSLGFSLYHGDVVCPSLYTSYNQRVYT
jgi:hypothetical protein